MASLAPTLTLPIRPAFLFPEYMNQTMSSAASNSNTTYISPHDAVQPGLFSGQLVMERPADASSSSRIYYRAVADVPFEWESQPGKPKEPPAGEWVPPLGPPPAQQSALLAWRSRVPREPADSFRLWLWTTLTRGEKKDRFRAKARPFRRISSGKCSNRVGNFKDVRASPSSSSLLSTWDGFFLPLEKSGVKMSTPSDEAGWVSQRWNLSRLLVCLNRGF